VHPSLRNLRILPPEAVKRSTCFAAASAPVLVFPLLACQPQAPSLDLLPPTGGSMLVPDVRDGSGVRIVGYGSPAGIDVTSWHLAMDDTVRIGRASCRT
jgi:hypothetical protein